MKKNALEGFDGLRFTRPETEQERQAKVDARDAEIEAAKEHNERYYEKKELNKVPVPNRLPSREQTPVELQEAIATGDSFIIQAAREDYYSRRNRKSTGHAKHCHSQGDRLLTCTCKPPNIFKYLTDWNAQPGPTFSPDREHGRGY